MLGAQRYGNNRSGWGVCHYKAMWVFRCGAVHVTRPVMVMGAGFGGVSSVGVARGVGVVVEGACFLVVFIGRLGHHGAGLVGMLNEIPAAVEHEFGAPAVQCESQAPPDLLEEDVLARHVVYVEELKIFTGELRGDQLGDAVESAGPLRIRSGDEAYDLPRVVGVELGRARLRVELRDEGSFCPPPLIGGCIFN